MKFNWLVRLAVYCLALAVPCSFISLQIGASIFAMFFLGGVFCLLAISPYWNGD